MEKVRNETKNKSRRITRETFRIERKRGKGYEKIYRKSTALMISVALVFGGINGTSVNAAKKVSTKVSLTKKVTVTVGKTKAVKLKNNKKIVAWKVVKGQKNVKLSKKRKTGCTVKDLKEGKATVRAVVGTKKYDCSITVKRVESPEITKSPVASEKPVETEAPVIEPSEKPVETKKPEETKTPENLEISEVLYYDGSDSCKIHARELDDAGKNIR